MLPSNIIATKSQRVDETLIFLLVESRLKESDKTK